MTSKYIPLARRKKLFAAANRKARAAFRKKFSWKCISKATKTKCAVYVLQSRAK